jgi:hypothetical protein
VRYYLSLILLLASHSWAAPTPTKVATRTTTPTMTATATPTPVPVVGTPTPTQVVIYVQIPMLGTDLPIDLPLAGTCQFYYSADRTKAWMVSTGAPSAIRTRLTSAYPVLTKSQFDTLTATAR